MDTREDNFEYAISQAVDGTLSDHDRFVLGERLRSPEANRLASEHARLTAMLRSNDPLPPIDFGAFAASIADAIDAEDAYSPQPIPMRPVWSRRFAVAAAVVLSVLAAWPFLPKRSATPASPGGFVTVDGPVAAVPTAPPVTQIAIGPSDAVAAHGLAQAPDAPLPKTLVVIGSVVTGGDLRPY